MLQPLNQGTREQRKLPMETVRDPTPVLALNRKYHVVCDSHGFESYIKPIEKSSSSRTQDTIHCNALAKVNPTIRMTQGAYKSIATASLFS